MLISDWSSDVCSSDLHFDVPELALHHSERMFHLRPDAGLVLFPALGVVTLAFALDRAQPGGLLRDQEARLHRLQLLEDLFARPLALAYCPRRHRTSADRKSTRLNPSH